MITVVTTKTPALLDHIRHVSELRLELGQCYGWGRRCLFRTDSRSVCSRLPIRQCDRTYLLGSYHYIYVLHPGFLSGFRPAVSPEVDIANAPGVAGCCTNTPERERWTTHTEIDVFRDVGSGGDLNTTLYPPGSTLGELLGAELLGGIGNKTLKALHSLPSTFCNSCHGIQRVLARFL